RSKACLGLAAPPSPFAASLAFAESSCLARRTRSSSMASSRFLYAVTWRAIDSLAVIIGSSSDGATRASKARFADSRSPPPPPPPPSTPPAPPPLLPPPPPPPAPRHLAFVDPHEERRRSGRPRGARFHVSHVHFARHLHAETGSAHLNIAHRRAHAKALA